MMNQLQNFNHPSFGELPVIQIGDKPHFGATAAAKMLGYLNTSDAIARHTKKDGVVFHEVIDSLGRTQKAKFISEGNLYRLITNSKLPSAEQFETWVFDEVLPSIRKHGAYLTPDALQQAIADPQFAIGLLSALDSERKEKQQLQIKIQEDLPYTNFGKVVSMSDGAINIGAFAKILYDKHGISIGRNKLIAWMRDKGFLIKQEGAEKNLPKQKYIERGWFKVRPAIIKRTAGDIQSGTTLITGKGQVDITNILLSEFSKEVI